MKKKSFKTKYSLAEVTLFIIFAFSLLAGHLLVIRRQAIKLSKPYVLDFTGISVSVPAGEGWTSYGSWRFYNDDSDIMLTAQLTVKEHVVAVVQWRYIIAPEKMSTFRLLSKRAAVGGAEKVKTGQYSVKNALIEWAHAKVPGGIRDVFFGVAQLGNGRAIEVEAMAPSDPELAKQIFAKVCKSLKYEPNELIKKGEKYIASVKDAGVASLIERDTNLSWERVYLFDKPSEDASGYLLEVFDKEPEAEDKKVIKGDTRSYISHGDSWIKKDTFFKCDDRFDTFFQQTKIERSDNARVPITVIEKTADGVLKGVSEAFLKDKHYEPGKNAVPEILFDSILAGFIGCEYDDMIIDIVRSECLIVPAFVSKMSELQVKELDKRAAYGVLVEHLDAKKKFDEILFDENKQIIRKIRKNLHVHSWDRSDRGTLIEKFRIKDQRSK